MVKAIEKKREETELAPAPAELPPSRAIWSCDPTEIVSKAASVAAHLRDMLKKCHLYVSIRGRPYVRVEGWTFCGTLLGVAPVTRWTRKIEGGWEARVEAVTLDGRVVGAAEAQCDRTEPGWANRPDYALRSMAQTRATSKAMRLPLGFIMALAGYETTPAEEVEPEVVGDAGEEASSKSDLEGDPLYVRRGANGKSPSGESVEKITDKQRKLLFAKARELAKEYGCDEEVPLRKALAEIGVDSTKDVPKEKVDDLLKRLEFWAIYCSANPEDAENIKAEMKKGGKPSSGKPSQKGD